MFSKEEVWQAIAFEGRPVATDDAVLGDDGLEDATVVVGTVAVFWREDDVATLITNKVFVVRGNQEVVALAEAASTAVVCEIKFVALPLLRMDGVTKKHNAPFAIADT